MQDLSRKHEGYLSITEWAKKNNMSDRQARRLVASGRIPSKLLPVFVQRISADFKLKK